MSTRTIPLDAIDQLHQFSDELTTIWLALGNTADLENDGTLTPRRSTALRTGWRRKIRTRPTQSTRCCWLQAGKIARTPDRSSSQPSPVIAAQRGFPPIDAFHGGRAVPLVRIFYQRYLSLVGDFPGVPPGEEQPEVWTRSRKEKG